MTAGIRYRLVEPNHLMFTHGIVITQAQGGGGGGQPGPNSPGAPTIPDGVWPMGYAGYVKGVRQDLVDLNRDWNFATDGLDLSGFRIKGKVVCRSNGITGDGFEIVGADAGTSANALLDCNTHFTGAKPNLKNFTILPTTPVVSTNGFMGGEATLFNFDISGVSDALSPNNLNTGLPLNLNCDWGYCHDQVYYYPDSSHSNGSHNDGAQIVGGTSATFSRIYMTGITDATKGQGAFLRSTGPPDGLGPRPLGQQNSSIQFTQNVSHVGDITFNQCRFGGGWIATINCSAGSGSTLGPITVSNSLFDGNNLLHNDIIYNPSNTTLVLSGNQLTKGGSIHVNSGGA